MKDEHDTTTRDWVEEKERSHLKTYIVRLEVLVGGYEKHTHALLTATDADAAFEHAAALEAHNKLTGDLENGWADDHMFYNPDEYKEVEPEDVETMKKYMHLFEYDEYIKDKLQKGE